MIHRYFLNAVAVKDQYKIASCNEVKVGVKYTEVLEYLISTWVLYSTLYLSF